MEVWYELVIGYVVKLTYWSIPRAGCWVLDILLTVTASHQCLTAHFGDKHPTYISLRISPYTRISTFALDIIIFRLKVSAFAQNLFQHGIIREAKI